MRRVRSEDVIHGAMNDSIMEVLNSVPSIRFISRLDEAMEARGITQTKLATLTGLRQATISEFMNGERSAITKAHLLTIMIALRITDVKEILDIEFEPETAKQFDKEAKEWKESQSMPLSVAELFKKNVEKMIK